MAKVVSNLSKRKSPLLSCRRFVTASVAEGQAPYAGAKRGAPTTPISHRSTICVCIARRALSRAGASEIFAPDFCTAAERLDRHQPTGLETAMSLNLMDRVRSEFRPPPLTTMRQRMTGSGWTSVLRWDSSERRGCAVSGHCPRPRSRRHHGGLGTDTSLQGARPCRRVSLRPGRWGGRSGCRVLGASPQRYLVPPSSYDRLIFDPFRGAGMLHFGYGKTAPWANRCSHSLRYSRYVQCAGRRCDKTRQMGVFGGHVRSDGTARGGIEVKRLSAQGD